MKGLQRSGSARLGLLIAAATLLCGARAHAADVTIAGPAAVTVPPDKAAAGRAAGGFDRLYRRDGTSEEGEVTSLSLSDVGFRPRGETVALLVPRAEVHRLVYGDGREVAGGELYDGSETLNLRTAYVREVSHKPYLIESKLTLSKKDIAERSVLRGFLVGSVITLFANGESKKIAFPIGFASQFLLAYLAGN